MVSAAVTVQTAVLEVRACVVVLPLVRASCCIENIQWNKNKSITLCIKYEVFTISLRYKNTNIFVKSRTVEILQHPNKIYLLFSLHHVYRCSCNFRFPRNRSISYSRPGRCHPRHSASPCTRNPLQYSVTSKFYVVVINYPHCLVSKNYTVRDPGKPSDFCGAVFNLLHY